MDTHGINATIRKFGWPGSLIADYSHWVVLLRPGQVTLGSLVLAARGEARAFGDLDPAAHAELATVSRDIEAALTALTQYDRINYLMLMMVDPHVHFHVIPRYAGNRSFAGIAFPDAGWPGPPDLKSAVALGEKIEESLRNQAIKTFKPPES